MMRAIPCPGASQDVSTCGNPSWTHSTLRPCSSVWLVMPHAVLTQRALRVKCFKCECGAKNAVKTVVKPSSLRAATARDALDAGKYETMLGSKSDALTAHAPSNLQAITANAAQSVVRSMKRHDTDSTVAATHKTLMGMVGEVSITQGGKTDHPQDITGGWPSNITETAVFGVVKRRKSYTTKIEITQTITPTTSNRCVASVIAWSIKSAASACASALCAERNTPLEGVPQSIAQMYADNTSDADSADSERRYSQTHQ